MAAGDLAQRFGVVRVAGDQVARDLLGDGLLPIDGTALGIFDGSAADGPPIEVTVPPGATTCTVIVNIVAISGAGATLTLTLSGWDAASAAMASLLVSAGLIATGRTQYKLGNACPTTANVSQNTALPRILQLAPVKSGTTTTLTYSIGVWFS